MQFKTLFVSAICFIAAAPVLGFSIPEGQGNGFYTVSKEMDGKFNHTRVGDMPADPPSRKPRSRVVKRTFDSMYCASATGQDITPDYYPSVDAAVAGLESQCAGAGIELGEMQAAYSISGSIVAFFCNFNPAPQNCYSWQFSEALGALDQTCGVYGAGTARDNGFDVSYGWEFITKDFCNF
jgi:hypothetical protein